ncbi:hypothetical protein TSUD_270480 [Trifolium subterraneum]|uniref:Transmembrane protein n=1 Tax=Trifolium subterraneum TaxID=3900 RepID=A0A2Z6N2Y0_TRISU|nr:hypothetical protein TSUD_270480 [Trifolium subterraneum]
MSKLSFVILLVVVNTLVLQAMSHDSEAQAPLQGAQAPLQGLNINPLDHKTQIVVQHHHHDIIEDHKVSSGTETPLENERESKEAEAPNIRKLGKHHSTDKSVAGGGVIIGGFVTAIFAAVFCYIRVTRKRDTVTDLQ